MRVAYPVILCFPHRQPRVVAVPAPPSVLGVLIHKLPPAKVRRVKLNDELVILAAVHQVLRDIDPLRDEHVVRLQDGLAVQLDRGKGVEPVKRQHRLGPVELLGRGKGGPVDPDRLTDPLHLELILARERIGDELVVQEVEVDVGRELRDGEVCVVGLVRLLEVPVLVDGDDAPHGGRCLGAYRHHYWFEGLVYWSLGETGSVRRDDDARSRGR